MIPIDFFPFLINNETAIQLPERHLMVKMQNLVQTHTKRDNRSAISHAKVKYK